MAVPIFFLFTLILHSDFCMAEISPHYPRLVTTSLLAVTACPWRSKQQKFVRSLLFNTLITSSFSCITSCWLGFLQMKKLCSQCPLQSVLALIFCSSSHTDLSEIHDLLVEAFLMLLSSVHKKNSFWFEQKSKFMEIHREI